MRIISSFLLLAILTFAGELAAQTTGFVPPDLNIDSTNNDLIHLVNSERGTIIRENDQTINIVVGDVLFEHKGNQLEADSAHLNLTNNTVNAYGRVVINQTDGTQIFAEKVRYNGNTSIVNMYKNVELISGSDHLWADFLTYNLKSQIGKYNKEGTLQSGNTIVHSRSATYNVASRDARFMGDVLVLDPEYEVESEDLNYNTDSRIVTFYSKSVILNDSATLYASSGTYDAANEVASFRERSSISANGQYMIGDVLDYDRTTGLGTAAGNVQVIDSTRDLTLLCGFATLNEITKQVLAAQNPLMIMARDTDTFYIIADTFYTEPTETPYQITHPISAQDSMLVALDLLKRAANRGLLADTSVVATVASDSQTTTIGALDTTTVVPQDTSVVDTTSMDFRAPLVDSLSEGREAATSEAVADTGVVSDSTPEDTSTAVRVIATIDDFSKNSSKERRVDEGDTDKEPRYFIAYRNVLVFNDSLQAKSDSLSYNQRDSMMSLYYSPIVWTRDAQVLGKEILARLDTSSVKWVKIPEAGILITQSTPANEIMFDQLQGKVMEAFFSQNKLDSVQIFGNAKSIFYAKDEKEAYIGLSQATAMDLSVYFADDKNKERKINRIKYVKDFEQTMYPIKNANHESLRVERFAWKNKERPKNYEAFMSEWERRKKQKNAAAIKAESKSKSVVPKK